MKPVICKEPIMLANINIWTIFLQGNTRALSSTTSNTGDQMEVGSVVKKKGSK
jgi:hypothetical protein